MSLRLVYEPVESPGMELEIVELEELLPTVTDARSAVLEAAAEFAELVDVQMPVFVVKYGGDLLLCSVPDVEDPLGSGTAIKLSSLPVADRPAAIQHL
eukprot:COSAG04_NODE_2447_length_4104_cov_2.484894_4_plen_98_part_00